MRKSRFIKSVIVISTVLSFIFSSFSPLFAFSQASEYLCEIGIKLYQQGKYDEALHEFKKALMVQSDFLPAQKYIEMINKMKGTAESQVNFIPETTVPSEVIQETLDFLELQKNMISTVKPKIIQPLTLLPQTLKEEDKSLSIEEKLPPSVLILDDSLKQIMMPIAIEQGESLIISGNNIKRFLITQQEIIDAVKDNLKQVTVTGKAIGYTYMHVWDDRGRWTLEFLGVLPKPEGPTVAELRRKEEERASAFTLRYALNWNSYEEGRRLSTLNRKSYNWYHSLSLNGATPYGDLDSSIVARALKTTTDVTHFTLGLNDGIWSDFKGFSVRAFDFSPGFANLAFSGRGTSSLRGVKFKSPAFNEKLDYTAFWGREGGGRYGNLSPGLQKTKDSFLDGLDFNYYPFKDLNFGFSVAHGYGQDRPDYLYDYAYDANAYWKMLGWNFGYEIGYDTEKLAQLQFGRYSQPDFLFSYELRNINRNFLNIGGQTWRRGELGGLFNLNFNPNRDLSITNRLDIYQDRLFPSPEDEGRWNEDYNFNARYTIDPTSSLRFGYLINNNLGKISQSRYQSPSLGYSKYFNFIRKIGTFVNFRHQDSRNFTSPKGDYINENLSGGIRFSLIGQLYYFFNQQWNWLTEQYTGNRVTPHSYETGVDLNSRVFNTPFYENIRFMFRDEEDSTSNLSFLSGQDSIEGYAELTYRPNPDREAYCSTRIRNVWAENPATQKRIEAAFNAGMRYTWDTGLRWEAVGNIEGYIFKDLNSDGLRQRDEAPVSGIKIWLGKDKFATTDIFGYYKFIGIRGRKAFISLDTQDLPSGFVLTVPQLQEAPINQGRTAQINFGIVSRSEIIGMVFFDADDNNEYNKGDMGIKDVIITLENGKQAKTDSDGEYSFNDVSVGDHTITLELNSLPLNYLPKVAISKTFTLFEGISYIHNIPLKEIKE